MRGAIDDIGIVTHPNMSFRGYMAQGFRYGMEITHAIVNHRYVHGYRHKEILLIINAIIALTNCLWLMASHPPCVDLAQAPCATLYRMP